MAAGPHEIVVRPRLIWAGVGVAVLGMLGIAAALVGPSHGWSVIGVVVLAGGLALCWVGGVQGDVHGGEAAHQEMREVIEGDTRAGVVPGQMQHGAGSRASTTRQPGEDAEEPGTARTAPGSWLTVGSIGLVVLAVWLLLSPWAFGFSLENGAASVILDQAIAAVVAGFCGAWLHQVGINRVIGGLAVLTSLGIVADGLFRHELAQRYDVNQVVTGVLMLGAAGACLAAASPRARDNA